MTLTPRQSQVLAYLRDYRREHGRGPTLHQVADEIRRSYVTAYRIIRSLKQAGYVVQSRYAVYVELTPMGLADTLLECPKEAAIREAAASLSELQSYKLLRWPDGEIETIRTRLLAAIGGKPMLNPCAEEDSAE